MKPSRADRRAVSAFADIVQAEPDIVLSARYGPVANLLQDRFPGALQVSWDYDAESAKQFNGVLYRTETHWPDLRKIHADTKPWKSALLWLDLEGMYEVEALHTLTDEAVAGIRWLSVRMQVRPRHDVPFYYHAVDDYCRRLGFLMAGIHASSRDELYVAYVRFEQWEGMLL